MIAAMDPLALAVVQTAALSRNLGLAFTRIERCPECAGLIAIVAQIDSDGSTAVAECCGVRRVGFADAKETP